MLWTGSGWSLAREPRERAAVVQTLPSVSDTASARSLSLQTHSCRESGGL